MKSRGPWFDVFIAHSTCYWITRIHQLSLIAYQTTTLSLLTLMSQKRLQGTRITHLT